MGLFIVWKLLTEGHGASATAWWELAGTRCNYDGALRDALTAFRGGHSVRITRGQETLASLERSRH